MTDAVQTSDADMLLDTIRGERGYTLSYHELLARTDLPLLRAYRQLYAAFALTPRHLDQRRRELIWTGLLTSAHEHVGSLHLERAVKAGVKPWELRVAVRLAGVCEMWDALTFAHERWAELLDSDDPVAGYRVMTAAARGDVDEADAELVMLTCAGSRMCETQFVTHLRRCYELGLPEEEIVEAVSYLLLPRGANTLLWATDVYLDEIRDGSIRPGPLLTAVSHETRRD